MAKKTFEVSAEVGYTEPSTREVDWELHKIDVRAESEFVALIRFGVILAGDFGSSKALPVRNVSLRWRATR